MADFTSLRATGETSFTNTVVREVVVQHETVTIRALQRVDYRRIAH